MSVSERQKWSKSAGRRLSLNSISSGPWPRFHWENFSDEKLLEMKFSELRLRSIGPWLKHCVAQVHQELEAAGIAFRPHYWVSTEWFVPLGIPGVALPFYLAHPRLARLERRQMLEIEGARKPNCLQLLRHELGHALENAFGLRRRKLRQRTFGSSSQPYPRYYAPRRATTAFVHHLDFWYAQSHPDEDFAETFAVWLNPQSQWRRRYQGWEAMEKLEAMEELMKSIQHKKPQSVSREEAEPILSLNMTLGAYYRARQKRYGIGLPTKFDQDLFDLFTTQQKSTRQSSSKSAKTTSASSFLLRNERTIIKRVADLTGESEYNLNNLMKDLVRRSRELSLRLQYSESVAKSKLTRRLAKKAPGYLRSGRNQIAI